MKMSSKIFQIFLFSISIISLCNASQPTVQVKNGRIQGVQLKTVEQNKIYYAFRGIPYAKPPVGNLRFEPPQPSDNWLGVLDTIKDSSPCVQPSSVGQEDCLYINVYTPELPKGKSNPGLPVMMWIHGGAFEMGDSSYDKYGPDYFLDQDIIFVSFNYRLGIFGFISLMDSVIPGNNGLKDQTMALQWVRDNIQNFGGDPNQVTLFGQSAGSASVSYHLQSPLSKGLFQKAIMESGTSYCLWAYSRIAPEVTKEVAKSMDINTSSSENIKEGLKMVNATFLQKKAQEVTIKKYLTYNPRDGFMFAPVLEKKLDGAFLTGKSYELIKSSDFHKVPVMIGYNSLEIHTKLNNEFRIFLLKFDLNPDLLVPVDMNIGNKVIKDSVGRDIKFKYFGLTPLSFSDYKVSVYISEDQFVRPVQQFARMLSKNTQTYLYKFQYEGELGGQTNRTFPGVYHGEELGYLFKNNRKANETDALTRKRMIKLWTNFAKYSNPTPEPDPLLQNQTWLPIDGKSDDLDYFEIDYNITSAINPDEKTFEFWNKMYKQYGEPPYDTY